MGIDPAVGDNPAKAWLIPHTSPPYPGKESARAPPDEPASHQVVGGVMAHQARDGSLVCEDDQPDWD